MTNEFLEAAIKNVQCLIQETEMPSRVRYLNDIIERLEDLYPDRLQRFDEKVKDRYIADMYAETKKEGWGERYLAQQEKFKKDGIKL